MSTPYIVIEAKKRGETSRQAVDRIRASLKKVYTHSSVTHKDHLIGIAFSDKPIGIDLEVLKERDASLFDWFEDEEWKLLGEQNWLNFYRLWTAKEAVIKKCRSNVDAIKEMRLVDVQLNSDAPRRGALCYRGAPVPGAVSVLVIDYHNDQHPVQVVVEESYVYGYTV